MSTRTNAHRQSVRLAFCGMTAALSVALMLLGGVVPIATYAVPMLASALLLPLLLEFDAPAAGTTYAAVALLSILLGMDKEAAFFYLFFGYYPIVKWRMDGLKPPALRLSAKVGLFAVSLLALYGLLALIFPLGTYLQEFREMGIWLTVGFGIVFLICMLLFDRLLLPLAMLYVNRVQPKLTFLRRG